MREETGDEILSCWYYGEDKWKKPIYYDMFFGDKASDMKNSWKNNYGKIKKKKSLMMAKDIGI